MGSRLARIVAVASTVIAMVWIGPGAAQAATLKRCDPFADGYHWVCTTVTSAPADGVRVLDRTTGQVVTWRNGTSVALDHWAVDTGSPARCGVHGDLFVWAVTWWDNGFHWGVIGDYYLNTGQVKDWDPKTDSFGNLGNPAHDDGYGTGTCNVFNPAPDGWTLFRTIIVH